MEVTFLTLFIFTLVVQAAAQKERIPSILAWTGAFESPVLHTWFQDRLSDQKCAKQCNFVPRTEMKNESEYDALIFHSRDLDYSDLPRWRRQEQLYLLFSLEAPGHRGEDNFGKFPPNFFNGTIGYSHLNNYIFDYDSPVSSELKMTADLLRSKTNSVLGVVSNCQSESGREKTIETLRRHVNMTLRGHCYSGRVSDTERRELIKSHRFVLALENKKCTEYVTEKGFKYKDLIVPIVYSRRIAEDVLPSDSFIAIDDFNSIVELAKHLKRLQNNDTEYMKYFAWLARKEDLEVKRRGTCQLCTDLHNRTTPSRHSFLTRAAFPDEQMCTRNLPNYVSIPIALSSYSFFEIFFATLTLTVLLFIFARSLFIRNNRYRNYRRVDQQLHARG